MAKPTPEAPNFIALQCPTCGAGLQVAGQQNQFRCDHCGNRYLLDRKLEDIAESERRHIEPKVTFTQRIQQWLRVGAYEVFLHSIGMETVQKKRVLYAEVAYRNSSNIVLKCRHNQWIVFDRAGYTYEPAKEYDFPELYAGNDKRYLGRSRVITPGMRLRGWLGFVIPASTILEYLQFSGGIPAKTVEFELHMGR